MVEPPLVRMPFHLGARDNTISYLVLFWNVPGGWYGGPTSEDQIGAPLRERTTQVAQMYEHTPASLGKITDGLSKTVMMFEQSGLPVEYKNGDPTGEIRGRANWLLFSTTSVLFVRRVNFRNSGGAYSFHPGGVNMSRFDGSVEFVGEDIDEIVLLRNLGRSDGTDAFAASE
jgi:prepilin-type processing-associated H-X9-DG protein